ncbi:two-component system regulatory protein YycI [Bacillus smithii]|uniref:two-component system regulatory protein YycI n=1 Tax=Bacillus smithii TaxID=1479 RepID=UPI0022DFCCF3|nr:two-component system regulatory protein YycI [Bacillus smithii]MED0659830.1 two-component system regulatory protein YycI [Bacillus smithii]
MDWSKTKTIFIFVFFILDIFLLTVFLNKHSASQFDIIEESSIQDKLKNDDIKYDKLPGEVGKTPLITAKAKTFTKKEVAGLNKQKAALTSDQTMIVSHLDKSIPLDKDWKENLKKFVKEEVLYGDHYEYWGYDKDQNQIIFSQVFKGNKLFKNGSGQILFEVNDNNEIDSYEQTMLEEIEENNKESVLPATQAVNNLYKNGMLKPNSTIKKAELGYYTLVQLTESQVLSPTWHFAIEHRGKVNHLFVNAFDGSIQQTDKE